MVFYVIFWTTYLPFVLLTHLLQLAQVDVT